LSPEKAKSMAVITMKAGTAEAARNRKDLMFQDLYNHIKGTSRAYQND
jgi:hypothetical protein